MPSRNASGRMAYHAPGLWETADGRVLVWRRETLSRRLTDDIIYPLPVTDQLWRLHGQDDDMRALLERHGLTGKAFTLRREALLCLAAALHAG